MELATVWLVLAAPLMALSGGVSLNLATHSDYAGGWDPNTSLPMTVTLPDAATMVTLDTMAVTLNLGCATNGTCGPWDFVAQLYVCDPNVMSPKKSDCATEIARWISPYGKAGAWTTDISSMLAFLRAGGNRSFMFWTPQASTVSLSLQMSNTNRGRYPLRAVLRDRAEIRGQRRG